MADYCTRDKLVKAYFGRIYSICHPEDWDVLKSIRSKVVRPPTIRTPVNQRKINEFLRLRRDPSVDNKYTQIVCMWIINVLSAIITLPSWVPAHLKVNQTLNNLVEDYGYAQFVHNLDTLGKTIGQYMLVLIRTKKPITLLMNNYLNFCFIYFDHIIFNYLYLIYFTSQFLLVL